MDRKLNEHIDSRMVFMSLPHGVVVQDFSGKIIYANKLAMEILGVTEETIEDWKDKHHIFDAEGRKVEVDQLPGRKALDSGKFERSILRLRDVYGKNHDKWSMVVSNPIRKKGKTLGVVNSFYDFTTIKKAEEEMRFLSKLGSALAADISVASRLVTLSEMVKDSVADLCVVDMIEEGKIIRRMAISSTNKNILDLVEDFRKKHPQTEKEFEQFLKFIKDGKPIYTKDYDDLVQKLAKTEEQRKLISDLEIEAVAIMPLVSRHRPVGILTFGWTKSSRIAEIPNVEFLENLAQLTAILLDNGRLYSVARREIKEQKKIQEILQQNENTLQLALDAGKMVTWDWDMETRIINWSAGTTSFRGEGLEKPTITFDEVLDKIYPKDRKLVVTSIGKAVKESGVVELDFRFISSLQKIVWVHLKGQILYDGEGGAVRMVGVLNDITERKKDEQTIVESEKKFRLIFEATADAIIVVNDDGKITDVNKAALRLWKFTKRDLLKLYIEELFINTKKDWWKKNGSNHQVLKELKIKRSDGEERLVAYDRVWQYIEGKNLFVVWDIHDQRIEEKRREHFLSIASHELRSPLTTIKAMVQIGKRRLVDGESKKVVESLEKIDEKANLVTRLINDLLDITRIREGRLELMLEFFDLHIFLKEMMKEFRFVLKTHNLSYSGSKGKHIMADKNRLAQVVTNLVRNAAKYSEEGSIIEVKSEIVKNSVQVSVKDKGMGISEADKRIIFELYNRGSDSRKERIKGLGVGLYISMQIIKQHRGKMWFESEENVGSTFYFSLPLNIKK